MDIVSNRVTSIIVSDEALPIYPDFDLYPGVELFPQRSGLPIVANSLFFSEMIAEQELVFGQLFSSRFEATVYDVDHDLSGHPIRVIQTEDNTEYIFTGIIDSCEVDNLDLEKKIVAYDLAYYYRNKNVSTWWDSFWENHTSATIKEVRESLLSWMGIQYQSIAMINDSVTVKKNVESASITFASVLTATCEINCCFPHFEDNVLKFTVLDPNTVVDITSEYEWETSKFEKFQTNAITGIDFYDSGNELKWRVGTATNTYKVAPNILLYDMTSAELTDIGTAMLNAVSSIRYIPASIPMIVSDFGLRLGTQIHTDHGNTYIFQNEYSGNQFIEQTIKAEGTKDLQSGGFAISSGEMILNEKILRISASTEEVSSELAELSTDVTEGFTILDSKIEQTASSITSIVMQQLTDYSGHYVPTANNSPAMSWDTEALRKQNLGKTFYNLDNDTVYQWVFENNTYQWIPMSDTGVYSRINQTAEAISLKVSKGDISSEISQEAGQISITSNRLIIQSTNFSLAADGTATMTNANIKGRIESTTNDNNSLLIYGSTIQANRDAPNFSGTIGNIVFGLGLISSNRSYTRIINNDIILDGDIYTISGTTRYQGQDGTVLSEITTGNIYNSVSDLSGNNTNVVTSIVNNGDGTITWYNGTALYSLNWTNNTISNVLSWNTKTYKNGLLVT